MPKKMVSTRGHPQPLPEPSKPSKSSPSVREPLEKSQWTHTPSKLTYIWLAISLPLVIWDTGYVLLRPHSMPGGSYHSLWAPYELYGRVDYVYGWKAFNEHNGFTSAQGVMNTIETLMYLYYVLVVYRNGKEVKGRGGASSKTVGGNAGATAVLVAFSAAVMTFSKTMLYWLNEYCSGFENIGHNNLRDLIILWIIPNGAWFVGSGYMIYAFGAEIIQGLAVAGENSSEKELLAKNE